MKRFGFLMLLFGIVIVPQVADLRAADDDKNEQKVKEKEKKDKEEEIDVEKAVERIAGNAGKVGDRLKEKDVGPMTRDLQKDILNDIDALIRKAQQPPPMNGDGSPPPMNGDPPPPMKGSGDSPMPKSNDGKSGSQKQGPKQGMGEQGKQPPPKSNQGSSGGGEGKKEGQQSGRRERKPRSPMGSEKGPMPRESGSEPGQDPMPMAKNGGKADPKDAKEGGKDPGGFDPKDGFGKASPKRSNDKFAELYKDVWGHLPDRMRQEMDLYYREQFMPRYSELLKKYYSSIAEQKKTGGNDK
jgi:hypothetical protein